MEFTVRLDTLVAKFKALADPTRLRLLMLLERSERTVKDLTEILGQSQPRISRHLKLLAEAGLVDRSQEGAWVYYRLPDNPELAMVSRFASQLMDRNEDVLAADGRRLDELVARRRQAADAYFSRYADEWDQIRGLHVPESDVESAILDAVGPGPFGSILDLGTGTGRMLELFADRCERGLGVDRSQAMLAVARSNLEKAGLGTMRVRFGDILNLGVPKNSFDLVVIHQVLHFLDDPGMAIREACSVLSPSGILLIADFAPHNLEFLGEDFAHVRLGISHGQMRQWLAGSGMKLRSVQDLDGSAKGSSALTVSIWVAGPTHRAGATVRGHV